MFLLTYFLVTGGIVYDIINEPPSIGMYSAQNPIEIISFVSYRADCGRTRK